MGVAFSSCIRGWSCLNTTNPLVSIITPVFNSSRFILDCISSVKGQTYENWELLLVDDGSRDGSIDIIKGEMVRDKRIKLIPLDTNRGQAKARNMGINLASGAYIAFLDSDDVWLPEKIEHQLDFMMTNKISFSFTKYGFIDESGNISRKIVKVPSVVDYSFLLKNTAIGCLTVMLEKNAFGNKLQMKALKRHEDYALWLSLLRTGCTAHGLQENLALYRVVKGSLSSNKLRAAKDIWKVYELEELGFFKAWWCFLNYAFNATKKRI